MQLIENGDQLLGVGAGTVVEGERDLALSALIAGVYASVRSIAALSAADCTPANDVGPLPERVWIRVNRPAVRTATGCVPPPPLEPAAITTSTTSSRIARPARVRRRRWCGCWLHLRPPRSPSPLSEPGGGIRDLLLGGVTVSGIGPAS